MNATAFLHDAFSRALLDPAHQPSGLRGGARATPRFAVHRNNMMAGLVDALGSEFPVTRELVGDDFFDAMARDYVHVDPPRSPIIAAYGAAFAGFIASYEPAMGVVYLADVARLERLRGEAFHAADAEAVDAGHWRALLADGGSLATARLVKARVRLQPACRWLSSKHPVRSIWQAHQLADTSRDGALAALDPGIGEDVLVHRPQWDVQHAALPAGGIAWLNALRDGATLDAALQQACTASPAASPDQLLAVLLQHAVVTAIESDEDC